MRWSNLQSDGIILDETFFWIEYILPWHEVAETPIIFFAVEQMLNFCQEERKHNLKKENQQLEANSEYYQGNKIY